MMIKYIEFKGEHFLLINGNTIATPQQYENFECSYAHLCKDGIIRRFGVPIGIKDDIREIKVIDIK